MIKRDMNRKTKRAGMTIVETGFAIVIGLVVIAGSIMAYKKLYVPMKGDAAFSQVSSVISAIERAKLSNNSAYPVAATLALPAVVSTIGGMANVPVILNEMGGAANSRDVSAWTYLCTAGTAQTITLTTSNFDDVTVAQIAATKVNGSLAPWTATVAGSTVVARLQNVVCSN